MLSRRITLLMAFSFVLASASTGIPAGSQSPRKGVWDANSSSSSSNQSSNTSGNQNPAQTQWSYTQHNSVVTKGGRVISRTGQPQRSYQQGYQNQDATQYRQNAYTSSRHYSQTQAGQRPGEQNTASSSSQKNQLLDYHETLPDGRKYLVHLPRAYNGSTALPVLLVFHGLGMNGSSVRALSAMDLSTERYGYITVYPDAIGGRWNDGVQPRSTTDDVTFVSDILDAMARKYKIDSRRVYACGISNGGFFVQRLACELSNRIAAIGVVSASGSYSVCQRCATRRGMPVVFFLGTDDPLIPREGETKELGKLGEALGLGDLGGKAAINSTVAKIGGVMTADDAPEFWAHNNSCSANPRHEVLPDRDTRDGCKVVKDTYGGGIGGSDVVVYTIEGGGHNWPGGMGFVASDIIGRTTNDINASEILCQFFQSKSR